MEGFGSNLELLGSATTRTDAAQGTLRYNGDGTGSIENFRTLTINHNATSTGQIPATESEGTCDLTYTVNSDRSFTQALTCTGTVLAGSGADGGRRRELRRGLRLRPPRSCLTLTLKDLDTLLTTCYYAHIHRRRRC